jgi:hypothetical protein
MNEQTPQRDHTPRGQRPNAEPTPEEIAAICAEIRAGWSPEEEQRRRAIPNRSPEIPIVPSRGD